MLRCYALCHTQSLSKLSGLYVGNDCPQGLFAEASDIADVSTSNKYVQDVYSKQV